METVLAQASGVGFEVKVDNGFVYRAGGDQISVKGGNLSRKTSLQPLSPNVSRLRNPLCRLPSSLHPRDHKPNHPQPRITLRPALLSILLHGRGLEKPTLHLPPCPRLRAHLRPEARHAGLVMPIIISLPRRHRILARVQATHLIPDNHTPGPRCR